MSEYMQDCIHLMACRRYQKIIKSHGKTIPRHCSEKCSAYLSVARVIETATRITNNLIGDAYYGYSKDDLQVENKVFMKKAIDKLFAEQG